jgi:hypothetical protein
MSKEHEQAGMTIFLLGLLSIVLCQILGPIGWMMGSQYLARCEAEGVAPNQMAVAGRMLAMVGTVFLALGGLLVSVELIVVVLSILAT